MALFVSGVPLMSCLALQYGEWFNQCFSYVM